MQHLIARYLAHPTIENARLLAQFDKLHPDYSNRLSDLELGILADAVAIYAASLVAHVIRKEHNQRIAAHV